MNIPQIDLPRIVIIGCGFAGLKFCKKINGNKYQIVLIDQHNYHTFQPLLYQVATGGLEPDSIAYPLRKVIKNLPNFYFRLTEVLNIDSEKRKIHTTIGKLKYDYLIIATGSKTNYFGNTNIEKYSMAMKNVPQSLNLRSLIIENFEEALLTSNYEERNALMNFVIVGGGPTGVELAGALAEMKKGILPKDYPDLDIRQMQINIVQGGDRLLKTMGEKASEKAEDFLIDLGVNVWKNVKVINYDGLKISTNSDLEFEAATVIWAAGVKGELIDGLGIDCIIERAERIKVDEFNNVIGNEIIFAIGDVSCMDIPDYPFGHPMMAQPAIQQGKHLAKNIIAKLENKKMKPFVYKDKGSMATIGRNKAVVDLKNWRFQGVFAWFVWMFVHLFSLIGFKNKAVFLLFIKTVSKKAIIMSIRSVSGWSFEYS